MKGARLLARLGGGTLAILALGSGCKRERQAPAPPAAAPQAEATAPLAPWTFYELGALIVIEGELDKPTRLTLHGKTLNDERDAEMGPVRWELYKPTQTQEVELRDQTGRRLAQWTFQALPVARIHEPPVVAPPTNGGPSDREVAELASRITWSAPEGAGRTAPARPAPLPPPAPRPQAAPAPPVPGLPGPQDLRRLQGLPQTRVAPDDPPPRVDQVPPGRLALPGSRAGLPLPKGPGTPQALPESVPQVRPVVPPRVSATRPSPPPAWADPRVPGQLPEPTPRVNAVLPPKVATARPQPFPAPATPRVPGALPEAPPQVQAVVPPRVGTAKPHSVATPLDPRHPAPLPEPAPEVRPVVPPRPTLPPGRPGLSARLEPASPAPLPEARRPDPRALPGPWPGAGEALNLIRGPRNGKRLVLTFDGGSNAEAATEILDTLRQKGIRTTFFLTGTFIQAFPDLTRRIAREGHEIGNHTQNHPHLAPNMRRDPQWTRERFQRELLTADQALVQLLGRPMDPLWRAPYGEHTPEIRGWAEELGYRHVGWSEGADTLDWATPRERKLYRTGDAVLERLHARLQRDGDGLIALMHLGSERDEKDRPSRSLAAFIDRALKEGWSFVTVGDYLKTMGKPAWDSNRRMAWLNGQGGAGAN